MRFISVVGVAAILAVGGCARQAPPPAGEGAVAWWRGGVLSLEDVEENLAAAAGPACREARGQAGGGTLDDLVLCYEEIARDLALEAIIRDENPGIEETVLAGDDDDATRIRMATYDWVVRERLADRIEVSEAEVEAAYEADPESYRQPDSVLLLNIFRRHDDPARPEATDAFLREVATRFEAGETWEDLARRHSHSETRLRGGLVGTVSEGRLPDNLGGVVFALPPGGVSEPIRVRGGSVIVHVRATYRGSRLSFDEVRRFIEAELRQQRLLAAIASTVVGEQPPEGSTILPADQLITALDGPDPDAIVLEIGDARVTVAQLRAAVELGPLARASDLDSEGKRKICETYTGMTNQLMLPHVAMRRGDPELDDEVEKRLVDVGTRRLVNRIIIDELSQRAAADPEALNTYWHDNQQHFQSPLRFRVRFWRLPFGDDPVKQLAEMEALRQRLTAGEIDLETAAAVLGGVIEDRDWVDHAVLIRQLPPKALTYLSELGDNGFTVPYQQADTLHLIELVDRQEPAARAFDEVREDVVAAYVVRHRQELYRQLADERFDEAGFVFDVAAATEALTQPL